jgi:3',5'-cyclic-AMP phosphodiesterase
MPLQILQLTDPHLFGGEHETLRGVPTLATFERTLAQALERDGRPDAVLLTGDLVQDDPAGYRHVRRLCAPLGVPVLCLPGNHDVPEALRRELGEPPFRVGGQHDIGDWRLVLLDSCVPGEVGGHLAAGELERLDVALAGAAGRHALVCLHHQPVSVGSRWIDEVGLDNAPEFFGVIERHANVRAIAWGHVHQAFDGVRDGVRLLATPSTCLQFLPRAEAFRLDERPPGWRCLALHANGALETGVRWAA